MTALCLASVIASWSHLWKIPTFYIYLPTQITLAASHFKQSAWSGTAKHTRFQQRKIKDLFFLLREWQIQPSPGFWSASWHCIISHFKIKNLLISLILSVGLTITENNYWQCGIFTSARLNLFLSLTHFLTQQWNVMSRRPISVVDKVCSYFVLILNKRNSRIKVLLWIWARIKQHMQVERCSLVYRASHFHKLFIWQF